MAAVSGSFGSGSAWNATKGIHHRPELGCERHQVLPLVGGETAMVAEMVEHCADQPDGCAGIVQDELGEQASGLAGQLLPQPGVDQLCED